MRKSAIGRWSNISPGGAAAAIVAAAAVTVASCVANSRNADEDHDHDHGAERSRGSDLAGVDGHESSTSTPIHLSSAHERRWANDGKDARPFARHSMQRSPNSIVPTISMSQSSLLPPAIHKRCQCEVVTTSSSPDSSRRNNSDHADSHRHQRRALNIQRSRTLRILTSKATQDRSLSSLYAIDWDRPPIGEGAFGHVLVATHRATGERVALKRIPKKLASREDFQREMEALLRIQKWGGHPHICALREHFDEGGHYYLILDLVEG